MAAKKVIIVVTNHSELGNTGNKTGYYLPEVAHPYHVFKEAGYDVKFVSPKGGHSPMDPGSKEAFKDDDVCKNFLNSEALKLLDSTEKPESVTASDYKGLLYAGGHGPMFDLPLDDPTNYDTPAGKLAKLCAAIYENGGVVGAVCHGPVGLVPVKINGESIVKGQTVCCFTNAEEDAVKLTEAMPFLLETKLKDLGAKIETEPMWQPCVKTSGKEGRLVTGQNPASATPMAQQMVKVMEGK